MDPARQLDRGPEHVEEPLVFAPAHRGLEALDPGDRARLTSLDGEEHELLARTRDRHQLPVGRDRAPVPEEVEPVREGTAVASVQVLYEDARPLAGRAAPDQDPFPVRKEVGTPAVDLAERDRPRLARSRRQEHELRGRAMNEGEDPLSVGRKRLGRAFPEPDRRRSVGSPQVGGGVAEVLRRTGSATIREQERSSIPRQGGRL